MSFPQGICFSLLAFALALSLTLSGTTSAQTLARPGWAGSGLNADPWWKQAIFYDLAQASPTHAPADYKAAIPRLDDLHALGVDALLLPMPAMPPQPATPAAAPISTPQLDDFDELLHQASRLKMRIVLSATPSTLTGDISGIARFWFARGVAGFYLTGSAAAAPALTANLLQTLRRATYTAVGQRVILSDYDPDAPTRTVSTPTRTSRSRRTRTRQTDAAADRPQLQVDDRLTRVELPEAANLRVIMQQSLAVPGDILTFHAPDLSPGAPNLYPALAKPLATILLTLHSAAFISPAVEPSTTPAAPTSTPDRAPTSLTDWYRQLGALHHANAALRFGNTTLLSYDEQNALAWVARPTTPSALTSPVVVICNLSTLPMHISLTQQLRALDLRGTYLRTLLRSDRDLGPQSIDSVSLPPFGVYIGELHR